MIDDDKTTAQCLIDGLQLMEKLSGSSLQISADHDIIYAGADETDEECEIADELKKLGWHYVNRVDSWAFFV